MAKQYSRREPISVRKKREEEARRRKWQKFRKTYKKELIITTVSVVLGIALIWAALDFFITPGGCIRDFWGNLIGVKDNWLVREIDDRYFKLGEFDCPEGFTVSDTDALSSDDKEQSVTCHPADEDSVFKSIYATGVKSRTAEDMSASIYSMYNTTSEEEDESAVMPHSELYSGELAGLNCYWWYQVIDNSETDDDGNVSEYAYMAAVLCYTDTCKDSCVLVDIFSTSQSTIDALPGEAEMIAMLETTLQGLRVEK